MTNFKYLTNLPSLQVFISVVSISGFKSIKISFINQTKFLTERFSLLSNNKKKYVTSELEEIWKGSTNFTYINNNKYIIKYTLLLLKEHEQTKQIVYLFSRYNITQKEFHKEIINKLVFERK